MTAPRCVNRRGVKKGSPYAAACSGVLASPGRESRPMVWRRAVNADFRDRPDGRQRPELRPGLEPTADDCSGPHSPAGKHIGCCGAEGTRSGRPERNAHDAPGQAPARLPDEHGLVRELGPGHVDADTRGSIGKPTRREDERPLAEVGVEPRRCLERAQVRVNQGSSRGVDGHLRRQPGAHVVEEQCGQCAGSVPACTCLNRGRLAW